ncbi:MAG: hypothetical protein KGI35_01380 [Burkholderiales bacterium]|nr:hypothetical protein [Burkholderiales bacterium]MDE2396342.1 hypothetical protein [Burkholderiales bacterium]
MKTAALPSIRIEPQLRADLEAVLTEGESLSSFVEAAVRKSVEYRRIQSDFHARGQAAWEAYQRTGVSYPVDEVLDKLRRKTAARRFELEARSKAR